VFGQEGLGRFLGAAAGPAAVQKSISVAKNLAKPNIKAEEELANALRRDNLTGTAVMSPDEIAKARAAGATPAVADMAGEETKKLIERFGRAGDDATTKLARLNNTIQGRSGLAGEQIAARMAAEHGAVTDAATLQTMMKEAAKPEIDRVYQVWKTDPKAAQVWTPALQRWASGDEMRDVIRSVEKIATDPDAGIIGRGVTGNGIIPRNGVPGEAPNLVFWDQAKRKLDDLIAAAKESKQDDLARRLSLKKRQLVAEVDAIVPSYQKARYDAAEDIGARNALEDGYLGLKKGDSFFTRDIMDKFNRADPQDQNLFRTGISSRLAEMAIEPGGVKKVETLLSSPLMQKRLKSVFGDDAFDAMYGHALANANLAKLKPFVAKDQAAPLSYGEAAGSAIAGGISVPYVAGMTGNTIWHVAAGAAGAVADVGMRAARNARERAMAPYIMQLFSSTDKDDLARLGKLAMERPEVKSYLERATTAMAKAGVTYERANPSKAPEDRPGRASGGRTSLPDHEIEADRYIALAERHKSRLGRETEPLLKHDDTSIAKALEVANQAI
jgi:hypothetical protein